MSYYKRRNYSSRKSYGSGRFSNKKTGKCRSCGRLGHWANTCIYRGK